MDFREGLEKRMGYKCYTFLYVRWKVLSMLYFPNGLHDELVALLSNKSPRNQIVGMNRMYTV
jgi:hypothetical protein